MTDEEGDDEEEEPEEIQVEIYDEEDAGESVEDTAKKQDVLSTGIGQSYNLTSKSRDVLKYGPQVTARGDKQLMEESKNPKLQCLSPCNVDVQNLERKLIVNDRRCNTCIHECFFL